MVYVDIDENVVYDSNQYEEDKLYKYYQNEPIFTVAYYDGLLKKISNHFKNRDFKILELGSGSGMFLRRARKMGIEAYGIDYSPYSNEAKKMFNLKIDIADIDQTIYKKEKFDVVISHATFEHLNDPVGVSKKLLKLLKKNGLFIISGIPNYNTFSIKIFKSFWNNDPPGHVNYFEKHSVKNLFEVLQLQPIKIKTYGLGVWFLWEKIINLSDKSQVSDKSTQSRMEDYEKINPTFFQKIITLIYNNFVLPNRGKNIDAWAVYKN